MSSRGLRRAPGGEKQTGDLEKENEGSKISLLGRECRRGIYFDSCESTSLKDFIRRNSVLYSSRKKKKYFCFVGFFFVVVSGRGIVSALERPLWVIYFI